MNRGALLIGLAVGVGAWLALRPKSADGSAAPAGVLGESIASAFVNISQGIGFMPFASAINLKANKAYVDHIRAVELQLGIPRDLLVRVAYQESRFRADIITGKTVSSAGAKGMFQLMPVHWGSVNPADWRASALYAGRYLVSHYKRFGTWQHALAAYNWGQGNLAKYGLAKAPLETRNYYGQILADVGGGIVAA